MPRTTIARWVSTVVCVMALIGGYALATSADAPSTYAPVTHQASSPVLGRPRPEATRGSSTIGPASPARASSDHVTEVVYASADTFIAPDVGEPRGDWDYIEVGGGSVGLLKFDLNGVIPPGAEVTDAHLALYLTDYTDDLPLYVNDHMEGGEVASFHVHTATGPWTEEGSHWTNASPVIGPDEVGSFDVDIPPRPQWAGCDVTPFVVQWHSGQTPNYGLAVTTESQDWFWFFSREGCPEHTPHLAIRYRPGPTPKPPPTPLPDLELFMPFIIGKGPR